MSVQQKIEESIEILINEKINLTGSGRTDSGVHALGQTANFRTSKRIDLEKFRYSLNSILPESIAVKEIEQAEEKFHSRFDAKKRSYIYLISSSKSPFYKDYSYFLHNSAKFEMKKLNELSKVLLGESDFTSFARKGSGVTNHICIIYDIHWKKYQDKIIFYVEANRFLHGMVRTMVGTILETGKIHSSEKKLLEILSKKDREFAGEAVPSKGLFLFKVKY